MTWPHGKSRQKFSNIVPIWMFTKSQIVCNFYFKLIYFLLNDTSNKIWFVIPMFSMKLIPSQLSSNCLFFARKIILLAGLMQQNHLSFAFRYNHSRKLRLLTIPMVARLLRQSLRWFLTLFIQCHSLFPRMMIWQLSSFQQLPDLTKRHARIFIFCPFHNIDYSRDIA